MKEYAIGIMQGRLSRPVGGRIQAFPAATWEEEFKLASHIGFDAIEWIFEDPYETNPLWSESGRKRIMELIKETGVRVDHVCADYFMQHPFFRVTEQKRQTSMEILKKLLPFCREIGAKSVEIPFLDNSRIDSVEETKAASTAINAVLPIAEKQDLAVALETSLSPREFAKFMEELSHPLVKVVYDVGNSASLGYDTKEEIEALGRYFSNVHIKDRMLKGSTVSLGQGNADFEKTFQALKSINYQGDFTLQVARGEEGAEIEWSKQNYNFVKNLINTYL